MGEISAAVAGRGAASATGRGGTGGVTSDEGQVGGRVGERAVKTRAAGQGWVLGARGDGECGVSVVRRATHW